ncbi:hypothetical protein BW737_014415 [Actinomyces ruminis]|uniref:Uncharacterized protein n=2 Tax=Actinomyces ruminis TaxID=1937003 RepID=A0ABX4M8L3_9ACTO|nr:hypothetical protein BW737_014415 [Actinomyces ruminis]
MSRQGTEHLSTMEQFIEQWARVDSADLGTLLKALKPLNDAVVELGKLTVRQLGEAHEWTGKKLDATLDTYVETDRQVYEEAARILRERGHTVLPFTDPRIYLPGLGAAARAAGPDYGGGKPSVIEQVYGSGEALRRYDEDQFYRAENRYAQAKSANRGIEEAQDASSYLVPPELLPLRLTTCAGALASCSALWTGCLNSSSAGRCSMT